MKNNNIFRALLALLLIVVIIAVILFAIATLPALFSSTFKAEDNKIAVSSSEQTLEDKVFFLKLEETGKSYLEFVQEEIIPEMEKEAYDAGYSDLSDLYSHIIACEDEACTVVGCYNCNMIEKNIFDFSTTSIGRIAKNNASHPFFIAYADDLRFLASESYNEGRKAARNELGCSDPLEYAYFLERLSNWEGTAEQFFVSIIPEIKSEGYSKGFACTNLNDQVDGIETDYVHWIKKSSNPFFKKFGERILTIIKSSFSEGKKDSTTIGNWYALTEEQMYAKISDFLLEDQEVSNLLAALEKDEREEFFYNVVKEICDNSYKEITQADCVKTFKSMYKLLKGSNS